MRVRLPLVELRNNHFIKKHILSILLALAAPVISSLALAADTRFMQPGPDAEVQKTYPILSKFNAAPMEK